MKKTLTFLTVAVFVVLMTLHAQEIKSGRWRFTSGDQSFALNSGNGDRIMTKEIRFPTSFESIPQVTVTVTFIDADRGENLRYDAKAISVSRDGFMLRVKTWNNTQIFGIGGSWFAQAEKLELNKEDLEVGSTIQLRNISFEFNKAELLPSSYDELDEVYNYLKDNPTVIIELSGHTDNVGSEEYNMKLSQERADAVKSYLVDKGIDPDRLVAKGYGESRPIATNDEDWGREQNRRVEFTILKK